MEHGSGSQGNLEHDQSAMPNEYTVMICLLSASVDATMPMSSTFSSGCTSVLASSRPRVNRRSPSPFAVHRLRNHRMGKVGATTNVSGNIHAVVIWHLQTRRGVRCEEEINWMGQGRRHHKCGRARHPCRCHLHSRSDVPHGRRCTDSVGADDFAVSQSFLSAGRWLSCTRSAILTGVNKAVERVRANPSETN